MISTLNDFKEQCWTIFNRFSKDLKKITIIIIIDQDIQFFKLEIPNMKTRKASIIPYFCEIFNDLYFGLFQSFT